MVTHGHLYVLHAQLTTGHHPQGHILSCSVFAKSPRQIFVHAFGIAIEERPNTGITDAASTEIRLCVSHLPVEVSILATEPSFFTGKSNHVFGIHHIVLVFHIELANATLIGMATDGIVGNTLCHPNDALLSFSFALHFHDPCFVRVADGECLTFGAVAVGLSQRCHHLDGFARGPRALQAEIDQRAIVYASIGIDHLLTAAIGGLANGYLKLIDVANDIIGDGSLRNLTNIFMRVPIYDVAHLSLFMCTGSIMRQSYEHAVVVGIVAADDRAIDRCFLSYNKISTSLTLCSAHSKCCQGDAANTRFDFHSLIIYFQQALKLMSRPLTLCVSAPTLIKSTPCSA